MRGAQSGGQLIAVHDREPDVEEHRIGSNFMIQLDRALGIVGDVSGVIPTLGQH